MAKVGKTIYEEDQIKIDISEFCEYDNSTGKVELIIPNMHLEMGIVREECYEELIKLFGEKTADEMVEKMYQVVQDVSTEKWVKKFC